MQVQESKKIPGLRIIQPTTFSDFRGSYVCSYNADEYRFTDRNGQIVQFVEDDFSVSSHNVLRGMHGDPKTWKLIQCIAGEIFFAVVDMRRDSPNYLAWETYTLNDKNRTQVLVPAGCANGHLCLSEMCVFSYKQSEIYRGSQTQFTVLWNDPKLSIPWPVENPRLSDRDRSARPMELA